MTEQERISKIEHSLADLERQLYDLKFEVKDLRDSRQTVGQTTAETDIERITSGIPSTPADIPITMTSTEEAPTPIASVPTDTPSATVPESASAPHPAPAQASAPAQKPVQSKTATKSKSTSKFEENLGGKVMGIVAAVLVFVGLFLFGSMLYERLGDTARVAILFIVSFLILGLGLFLERKRKSWFTTSLVGCGFGAIYITLFLTALYFGMFEVEVLYILLFFWLLGTGLYVFLRQSFTVALLGQIGIAFSVIFGCLGIESGAQFTFLCIYFTVLSLLYLWVVLWRFLPNTENKPYSWIHLTAFGLNLIQLWVLAANYGSLFGDYGEFSGNNPTAATLLCIYCLVLPLFFLLRRRSLAGLSLLPQLYEQRTINKTTFPVYKSGTGSVFLFTTYQIIVWIVFALISECLFEAEVPTVLFLLGGLLVAYLITELFGTTGTEARGSTIVNATAVCFTLILYDIPLLLVLLIPILFCTVTTLFGIFGNECPLHSVLNSESHRWEYLCTQESGRCFDKFTAFAYLFPILFSYEYEDPSFILFLIAVFGIAYFTGNFVFLFRNGWEHRFSNAWKTVLYVFGMFYVFTTSAWIFGNIIEEDIPQMALVLSLLVLCNCAVYYTNFRKKLDGSDVIEPVINYFVRVVHSALWIWGIALLHSSAMEDHPLLCIWLVILTLYLCGSGLYEQYKQYSGKTGLGIYFGLRITVYTIAVMTAFEGVEGYFISCILLILAVFFVLAGFPLRLAPLRIYGLCLAMLAVIKLLMIDIEHDNSMETVLCFLGAGILCFAINFIYNHVKKRFKNE